MINKRLMASGSWDLALLAATPRSVRRTLEISEEDGHGFASLIVTPARFRLEDLDADDIFDEAEYVGVHRANDGLIMSGTGVEFWGGDEYGKMDVSGGTIGSATQAFAAWVAAITSNALQLSAGSVEAIAGNVTWSPAYPASPRDMLDYICTAKGAEWRINHDRTVDAGTIAHLYSTTPKAIIAPQARGGPEPGGYRGITGKVRLTSTVDDWAGGAEYSGTSGTGGYTRATLPYVGPDGDTFVPQIFVLDDSVTSADAVTIATARLLYGEDTLRQTYTVEGLGTRKPLTDIGGPGEYLYVFDPAELLIDTANQVHFQGRPCWPVKLRIIAASWPLRRGHGVYYRHWDGTLDGSGNPVMTTIDLTDYVDWSTEEGREASLEVGHPSMSWVATQRARYEEWLGNR